MLMSSETSDTSSVIDGRIEDWRRRLIDLTRRNRLVYFRPTRSSTLTISRPDPDVVFHRLVAQGKPWTFWYPPEEDDENNEPTKSVRTAVPPKKNEIVCEGLARPRLEQILKNLYRRSTTDYRERGVRILYVAFGQLSWIERDHSERVQSPLLLCSAELTRTSARDPFELHPVDEDPIPNPALHARLKRDFNVELPPCPDDYDENTLNEYLQQIANLVEPLKWTVDPTAQVALFSFHKLVMYQDLAQNAGSIKAHRVIRALCGEPFDRQVDIPELQELDAIQQPEQTFQILDADSSQQQCIQAALRGASLVLQGPPGTGKSQTIANIIGEFLARGKTILFVSEKMAALEVVSKRLDGAGLSQLCLELHSYKADKREVVNTLKSSLEESLVPRHLPPESSFSELMRLRDHLNAYVTALHERRQPLGESVYHILGSLAQLRHLDSVTLRLPQIEQLVAGQLKEWESLVGRLKTVWSVIREGNAFPWLGCRDDRFGFDTKNYWSELLRDLISALASLLKTTDSLCSLLKLDIEHTLTGIEWLIKLGELLTQNPHPHLAWFTSPELAELSSEAQTHRALQKEYQELRSGLETHYRSSFFDLPGETAGDLDALVEELKRLLRYGDSSGEGLLAKVHDLDQFVRDSPRFLQDALQQGKGLAARFGLAHSDLSLERVKELAQLAALTHSSALPESQWLDLGRIEQVRLHIANIRPLYEEYNRKRGMLLERYTPAFLQLDLHALATRFDGWIYRSFLRSLHPGYRRDVLNILKTARDPELSRSIRDHLRLGIELQQRAREIESQQDSTAQLVGAYFRSYDTDFSSVTNALSTAESAIRLAGILPIPEELRVSISLGGVPKPEFKRVSERLLDGMGNWLSQVEALADLIPVSSLPSTGLPLSETPIDAVQAWIKSLSRPVAAFCTLVDAISVTCSDGLPSSLPRLVADLRAKDKLDSIQRQQSAEAERLKERFGERYSGIVTDWADILAALNWTHQVREIFQDRMLNDAFLETIQARPFPVELFEQLVADNNQVRALLAKVMDRFDPAPPNYPRRYFGRPFLEFTLDELIGKAQDLLERIDDLRNWVDFRNIRHDLVAASLGDFVTWLEQNPPEEDKLVDMLRKSVFQGWLDAIFAQDNRLHDFRALRHDQTIRQFRDFDRTLVRLACQRIVEQYNTRKPANLWKTEGTEIAVLQREAAKKRRHLPVRSLFERMPNLLQRLKPCLLMSPLSVSQFLHPERLKFDLVVFDEASQIFTEDAVGAIYRGNQLIVAGDSKQLPPTDFFKGLESDQDEIFDEDPSEISADYASVLDECGTILPSVPNPFLRWHYRSRHESLITFSNHQFYRDHLVTFPSSAQDASLGIEFRYVPDGVYDRGGKRNNLREAQVVADWVFEIIASSTAKSLGVITFSQPQAAAVEDEIENRRRSHPEFEQYFKEDRLDGFFVKNLENVQGDERDIIIFSVGYGYDQNHQMSMNFGPLNKSGGERRLNVAITRAREKVIVVSSIRASDLKLSETQAPGVLNLYHYLNYAERGLDALALTNPLGKEDFESPLEESVANEIRGMGYHVIPQVGCSGYRIDIGVLHPAEPGRFLIGVECDGATYHSTATARDRDRLRQQVLESLGWRIHRVWSQEWIAHKNSEMARLKTAIELAQKSATGNGPRNVDDKANSREESLARDFGQSRVVIETAAKTPPGTIPYRIANLAAIKTTGLFQSQDWWGLYTRLLAEIVATEGPVHMELAAERMAPYAGISRVGPGTFSVVKKVAELLQRAGSGELRGQFLWPCSMGSCPVRVPLANVPISFREIRHIPSEELQAAMTLIVQHTVGITKDTLVTECARLFGFGRTSEKVRARLHSEYSLLLGKNKIVESGDAVILKPDSQ
jgi:very-short-patch-repair endonuclease